MHLVEGGAAGCRVIDVGGNGRGFRGRPNGAGDKTLTADYFGWAREQVQAELGGIAIVGPETLGREESPVQVRGTNTAKRYAQAVAELITRIIKEADEVLERLGR